MRARLCLQTTQRLIPHNITGRTRGLCFTVWEPLASVSISLLSLTVWSSPACPPPPWCSLSARWPGPAPLTAGHSCDLAWQKETRKGGECGGCGENFTHQCAMLLKLHGLRIYRWGLVGWSRTRAAHQWRWRCHCEPRDRRGGGRRPRTDSQPSGLQTDTDKTDTNDPMLWRTNSPNKKFSTAVAWLEFIAREWHTHWPHAGGRKYTFPAMISTAKCNAVIFASFLGFGGQGWQNTSITLWICGVVYIQCMV